MGAERESPILDGEYAANIVFNPNDFREQNLRRSLEENAAARGERVVYNNIGMGGWTFEKIDTTEFGF